MYTCAFTGNVNILEIFSSLLRDGGGGGGGGGGGVGVCGGGGGGGYSLRESQS